MARPQWEALRAPHFGRTKRLLIYDTEIRQKHFERNPGLFRDAIIGVFEDHSCTDANFLHSRGIAGSPLVVPKHQHGGSIG
jgi:hypothetical protein